MRSSLSRRTFLKLAGPVGLGALAAAAPERGPAVTVGRVIEPSLPDPEFLTLFLCGDVMTGRGIDQVLPHPGDPRLHERWMKSALGYVALAEKANGRIPRPVDFSYIWGDALEELERAAPDVRIVNLETAVTRSDDPWPDKGIHYRMHPKNVTCLSAAGVDCCALANNHVLDWGRAGLAETLETLERAKLKSAGAGRNQQSAAAAAVLPTKGKGRVLVFSLGHESSGILPGWAAGEERPGVNLLEAFSDRAVERLAEKTRVVKRPGDVAVASIHWGGNWGYKVPDGQRSFAHRLIDRAGIDLVHGHSSHHPKGIEVYRGRPILYGCGDFIDDYEGIQGHEEFRDDLRLMYFPGLDPARGGLERFEMVPLRVRRFRLDRASPEDARWLAHTLDRESERFGCRVELTDGNKLRLRWKTQHSSDPVARTRARTV